MKILVTGGAGFIGSHVVDKYISLGHDVVVIVNLSTGKERNINKKALFYQIDICNKNIEFIIEKEKPDILNHHAAQISVPASVKNPILDAEINVLGFLNLLQNCVKYNLKKVIFISSGGAIYGEAEEFPTSETYQPIPLSPYAIHKFVSEKYLHYYYTKYNLNYTTLRYANVYGPRQMPEGEAGVVSIFINRLLKEEASCIYTYKSEPEGMIRDYVYVNDVVRANVLALDSANTEAINIGTGTQTTTLCLYNEISKQLNKRIKPLFDEPRPGDIRKSCLNIEKAKNILNWMPEYSLEQGIKDTIENYQIKI